MGSRGGYLGKFLRIDLSSRILGTFEPPEEDLVHFLGNKGLATKILYDEMKPGIDPLLPESPLGGDHGSSYGRRRPDQPLQPQR